MRPLPFRLRALAALVASVAIALAAAPAPASADVGYQGPSFSGTSTPTGAKRAESLLWFHDGSWWAVMWAPSVGDFHIFRLDRASQKWIDTGVAVDTRSNTQSDVLWDAARRKLYVA